MGFFDVQSGVSAKLKDKGDTVTGRIIAPYSERQATEYLTDKPKFKDDGQPAMMAVIELQTDQRDPSIDGDDGIRIVYAEKFGQRVAIGDAIRLAGAKDLEVGGILTLTCTGETPSTKGSALKTWSATYVKAVGGLAPAPAAAALTKPAEPAPAAAGPDLVAIARAAQQKAAAAAPAPATNGVTNGADPAADLLKIRELSKLGFDAGAIHAAMPSYGMDAIAAVLAI